MRVPSEARDLPFKVIDCCWGRFRNIFAVSVCSTNTGRGIGDRKPADGTWVRRLASNIQAQQQRIHILQKLGPTGPPHKHKDPTDDDFQNLPFTQNPTIRCLGFSVFWALKQEVTPGKMSTHSSPVLAASC